MLSLDTWLRLYGTASDKAEAPRPPAKPADPARPPGDNR